MDRGFRARVQWLAVASGLILAATGPSAAADTFKPTRFDDPKPGKCKPNDCSLREAISAANNRDGRDKVAIPRGHYSIERPDDGTDDNQNGDFDVKDEVVIGGKGPKNTIIDGKGVHNVFTFLTFPAHTLRGVTVRGGAASQGGGGIATGPSPLTLKNVVVKGNDAPGDGGGIRTVSPEVKLTKVTVKNNHAGEDGGGIWFGVSVADAEISIKNSTISGNRSGGDGGGIAFDGTDTVGDTNGLSAELENSTVDGNDADVSGGGLSTVAGAVASLDNATVAHNTAEADGAGGGTGGGIRNSAAAFQVSDSIVAANAVGTTGANAQCSGAFLGTGNVLTTPAGCNSFSQGPDQLVADALIGALASNGGPTKTVKLLSGSPAIGFTLDCPARDQRGEKRPADNCDAGAFERKKP